MIKIISGGQTGVDQTALLIAHGLGLATGGYAPKGWRTDEGPAPWLADYGLTECVSPTYRFRTRLNVRTSHGTVLFGHTDSPGCVCTVNACLAYERPYKENPTFEELVAWLIEGKIEILNVAGNRKRTHPEAMVAARKVLEPTLEFLILQRAGVLG